jgi:catechol-2,3-dioxygenase
MFEKLMATAVLPASDLVRARNYWREVLGHEPIVSEDTGDLYDFGGTIVLVYETEFAGTAKNTALNLITENLDRDMTALRTHGVTFHEYDMPGLKTVDGVAEFAGIRGAWFSDSEGNIIAIGEPSPEMRDAVLKGRSAATGS